MMKVSSNMESYTRIFLALNEPRLEPGRPSRTAPSAFEARSPRAALRLGLNGPTALRFLRRLPLR
jgi:hypothetical protein